MAETNPPDWLRPAGLDGFHYAQERGDLVVFPCPGGDASRAVLDGAFSSRELRQIADWMDRPACPA